MFQSSNTRRRRRGQTQEATMAVWTAPIVEETPVGLEVTSYSPAEL
ncbi:pyrroloquinoline quinone precursor peptide PqqA [Methylopila henanensis]